MKSINCKMKSRRNAIAFAFWQELVIADIDEYQPCGKVPIYKLGCGSVIALREGEQAPDGYEWKFIMNIGAQGFTDLAVEEDAYGYAIWWCDF